MSTHSPNASSPRWCRINGERKKPTAMLMAKPVQLEATFFKARFLRLISRPHALLVGDGHRRIARGMGGPEIRRDGSRRKTRRPKLRHNRVRGRFPRVNQ